MAKLFFFKRLEEVEFSVELFKELIGKISIAKDPVKLRVKRGFEFDCFVEKFSKSWAKKKMSNNLIIDYVGEAGIDDGGHIRDFFCGTFIWDKGFYTFYRILILKHYHIILNY